MYGLYPDLSKVKRALVIKLRHHGDVLLSTPVFTLLGERVERVDALVYEDTAPMLEGHPSIGRIHTVKRQRGRFWRRLGEDLGLLWRLRKERYDLVMQLTEGDRGAWVARASGASIRVGYRGGAFDVKVKSAPGLRHTVERNLDALRAIGIFPKEEERGLVFVIGDEARRFGKGHVLVHPASRWRFKCWPHMRELVEELVCRGERVVLSSGPDPMEVAMTLQIGEGLDVENLAGKVSLKELGALIEGAKAVVTVDSLPLHLASALKKPVVAIFGPTSDVTWGPWENKRAKVVSEPLSCRPCYQDGCGGSKYSDCLYRLKKERVLEAFDELIKGENLPLNRRGGPQGG
jgi:heptosyltransferase-3